jgi:hypothetical protein
MDRRSEWGYYPYNAAMDDARPTPLFDALINVGY